MAYNINIEKCNACGICAEVCMNNAVLSFNDFYIIDPNWCIECGCCSALCYNDAIHHEDLEPISNKSDKIREIIEFSTEGDLVLVY